MIHYGFQRLALLNSAGYRRAELPLDAAVSMVAPNNTGKTSLINALQFLLIVDRRRMDFGAHDAETSRRFYFPHNSAYILLEVALPTTGTLVLGCVGKGVSHDYEYFAYRGQLDLDHYRLADGSLVQQPQLKAHMATLGRLVFSYAAGDFADALYGRRRKLLDQEPDFTVFKLEHASQAEAFQRVLTRTLRLDKLRSSEVKDYLLAIFRRDLPDASIDFKAEWDKAFAEVNADRAQYQAAVRQQTGIAAMARQQQRRLALRGKLVLLRPLIETRLAQWQAYFQDQRDQLQACLADTEQQQSGLQAADRALTDRKGAAEREGQQLRAQQQRCAALATEFALIGGRSVLETALATESATLARQIALVHNASGRSGDAIRRDLDAAARERDQLRRELATLSANLYLDLQAILSPAQLDTLNRVLSQQAMTLAAPAFAIDATALRRWLAAAAADAEVAVLPGLRLATAGLAPQHSQRSPQAIEQRLAELAQLAERLALQLTAADDLETARREQDRLNRAVRASEAQLQRFDEWRALDHTRSEREAQLALLGAELASLGAQLDDSLAAAKRLRTRERELQARLDALAGNHREITRLREDRRDDAPIFASLADLPQQPWLGGLEVTLDHLATALAAYHRDCDELLRLDRELDAALAELRVGGLTKFQFTTGSETEIQRIIEFAAHLAQEDQALERKARSAVVNVTACLRELRDGLVTFKSRMRDFNRLISRRQLSDLAVFKIEPVDERELVEAVEHLISTAEHTASGATFELFNHGSVLDDATLNRAKSLLIHAGEVRGCLRVEHFFRLEFVVGKQGRATEAFADMDSAASNGTVLMAKLVTGLALLHLMQDKRYNVRAVCYLDEAASLDQRNQLSLIETAEDFGFALIFAAPTPLITARYCVPISSRDGYNHISRKSWQVLEPLEPAAAPGRVES